MEPIIPKLHANVRSHIKGSFIHHLHDDWKCIRLLGERIHDFLQGQITQDVGRLSSEQAIYACVLKPQGKAVAEIYLLERSRKECLILCPAFAAQACLARLRRFSLGYQVKIEPHEETAIVSLIGSEADQRVEAFGIHPPTDVWLSCRWNAMATLCALRMDQAPAWLWLIGDAGELQRAFSQDPSRRASKQEVEALRIIAGRPAFGVEWDERMHPLNANLVEFQGVSFRKGCYVGQEVTSRMHWRGGIRWKLCLVSLEHPPRALPCEVRKEGPIGELRSAAMDDQGRCFGIARIARVHAVEGECYRYEDGKRLRLLRICRSPGATVS